MIAAHHGIAPPTICLPAQESKPSPSRSSVRSHRLRRPWSRSACASDARVSWTPAYASGSGGNGIGFDRTSSVAVRSVSSPAEQVEHHVRTESRRADAEAGVAGGVRRLPAVRRPEERAEPAAHVDHTTPGVREAEPVELRERLGEVVRQQVERLGPVVERRADLLAEVVDRVVPAEQDPVVGGEPVVVELVGGVADALPVASSRSRRAGCRGAARSSARSRRPGRRTAGPDAAATGTRWCRAPPGAP